MENINCLKLILLLVAVFIGFQVSESCIAGEKRKESKKIDIDVAVVNCPHQKFVDKHVCFDCRSTSDALSFSLERNKKFYPVSTNTVFVGRTVSYRFNSSSDTCEHDRRIQTFQCRQLNSANAFCTSRGNCVASHHKDTGHLFYQNMIC